MSKGDLLPPELGVQFREHRGVERVMVKNPEVQQRGLKFLLGLWTLENDSQSQGDEEVKSALKVIIRAYVDDFPECLQSHNEVDSELPYDSFTPDPQVLSALQEVLHEA